MNGEGIQILAVTVLARMEPLRVTKLRLSGLRRVTDEMMELLGKTAPDLEVLDFSYALDLYNSVVAAFVSCTEDNRNAAQILCVQLNAREAGRDSADQSRYWRRVTRLRQFSLSSCIMLTDHVCSS
ncbi:hypothetical protein A0H81_07299 [Grifola frondosa]|uniref:Uncharacterized protein n=1 Tax=Grifola frondosa TaxID=5627 RepID=A0A1C7MA56_GRIFR|nr:hypothetical protein A0H81_07299 [Grifola frondosa]